MNMWSKEAYLDMNPQSPMKIYRKALYVEQTQAPLVEAVGRQAGCWWGKDLRIMPEMKMFTKRAHSLFPHFILDLP